MRTHTGEEGGSGRGRGRSTYLVMAAVLDGEIHIPEMGLLLGEGNGQGDDVIVVIVVIATVEHRERANDGSTAGGIRRHVTIQRQHTIEGITGC